MIAGTVLAAHPGLGLAQQEKAAEPAEKPGTPPTILLNDYLPNSIYKIRSRRFRRLNFLSSTATFTVTVR